jgi:Grap2 and cyclin-D-interacting, N-terminal/Grap2 and cyclin-D-interacting, C-terminal
VLAKWLINCKLYSMTLASELAVVEAPKQWTLAEQKSQLSATVSYVRDRATKFTVAYDGSAERADCEPFSDMLLKGLVSLLACYQQMASLSGACKRELLCKAVGNVFVACERLVSAFAERHLRADDKVPPSVCGQVWSVCDALASMPLDDRQLLYKRIGAELRMLKDAMAEVKESAESSAADSRQRKIESVLASAGVELSADDVMWMGSDEELSAEERARMSHLLKVVRLSCVLVDKLNRQLVHERNHNAKLSAELVAFIEPFLLLAKRMSARVDDLVIAFEPPHERAEIEPALDALRAVVVDILAAALEHPLSPARDEGARRQAFALLQTMFASASEQLLSSLA